MDPRDLGALFSAWREKQRRADLRFATIVCALVNSNPFRDEKARPIQPADVFASLPRVEEDDPGIAEKILAFAATRSGGDSLEVPQ